MAGWQFTPMVWLYIASAIVAFILSIMAWRMRPVRSATVFSFFTFSAGIWTIGYILGFFHTDLAWKLAMLRVEYLGIVTTTVLWLVFIFVYTQRDKALTVWFIGLLSIIPAITFVQILFVQQHDIFYRMYDFIIQDNLVLTQKDYGPGFYLWFVYSDLVLISGGILLIISIMKMPRQFRNESIILGAIVIIVLGANILYVTGNNPLHPYDTTPLTFAVVGILFMVIMRRYRFLDVIPVAHNLIFKDVDIGVIVLDKRAIILELNPIAEIILKSGNQKLVGESFTDVFPNGHRLIDQIEKNTGRSSEILLNDPDRIYEVRQSPFTSRTGEHLGYVIMLYDISQRRRMEQELRELLDTKNRFFSIIAHDLRGPLGSTTMLTEHIVENPDESYSLEEMREVLWAVHQSNKKVYGLLENLLTWSRIQLGTMEVKIEKFPVETIILNTVEALQAQADNKNIFVELQIIEGPVVQADRNMLSTALRNLLSNAIKFSHEKSKIIVRSNLGPDDNHVMVQVIDNGIGIPDKVVGKLFQLDNNYHVKGTAGEPSTGLGLLLVKDLVEKCGGLVSVTSNKGEGSVFTLTLPVVN